MADQVNVTSIDALEAFRSTLILFVAKARRSLDEVGDDVRRTRGWLEHDRRTHWGREVARRKKMLSQAQQDLMSAKFSELHDIIQVREAAVAKAMRELSEAEGKVERVKGWIRSYDSRSSPLVKRLESLSSVLDHDMPKAISYLVAARTTLEEYAELPSAPSSPSNPAAADPPAEPDAPQ